MDTLTKLFGNPAKVKIIKLFVFNPGASYDLVQIADRAKESISKVRREVSLLEKMGLIRRRSFYKYVSRKKRGQKSISKVKTNGFTVNENFEYIGPLQSFLVNLNHLNPKDIARKLQRGGTLKLVVVSGIFIQKPESRVDLLVVGDHLKRPTIEKAIKTIESEIGKEIRYAVFETADFHYRLGLYDKLIRDILDFPHEKVINKLGTI
jgi:hypothetical protein